MMARLNNGYTKVAVFILLLGLVALLQLEYDAVKVTLPASSEQDVSPFMVRLLDMGFHPAVASFLWATTMPEILDLWNGKTEYFTDLAFVNAVDPKLSYPYAFSVLTLTAVPSQDDPDAIAQSTAIGEEGIANGDPDWRIPYYMATNEFLYAKDDAAAAKYYDMAANTLGVPQYAARFSLNFGIETDQRAKTEQLWETIKDSTNDPDEKARAQAYIDHLEDFDYLDAASKAYKAKFGVYPTSTDELVAKGIIPSVPVDPFGFTFIINSDGTSAIDLATSALPSYILAEPSQ
ncbi:MAG TPA: hypothetical protein VMA75_01890 [Candidatus Paceibacterota bacterium]|nr:hypothetical protein [Candidatus Paceibacterota bacterium]